MDTGSREAECRHIVNDTENGGAVQFLGRLMRLADGFGNDAQARFDGALVAPEELTVLLPEKGIF